MSENTDLHLFETLHHVCIVVPDLEAAVTYYESLGVGPWDEFPSLSSLPESTLTPAELASLSYRSCDLDNMQLQLCEPGPGSTAQRRFLEEKGGGVYHLGFTVPSVQDAERQGVEAGVEVRANGRKADGHGFTYFETVEGAGVVLEVRSAWDA